MRHRKQWRSPEACVAVSLLSLFLDLRMLTGTGCFPWKPWGGGWTQSCWRGSCCHHSLCSHREPLSLSPLRGDRPPKAPLTLLPSPGSHPALAAALSFFWKAAESWAPDAFSCEGEFAETQNDLPLNPGSPRMLWTTPSLLSLVSGPIFAVEFFASQKPLWEGPRGAWLLSVICTEAQAWWYPQPQQSRQGIPQHTRGWTREAEQCLFRWPSCNGGSRARTPVLRPDLCRPLI